MTDGRQYDQAAFYHIKVKGLLDLSWADWFDSFVITPQANAETLLFGKVVDQCALHGLLEKIRDLGLPLLLVERLESEDFNVGKANKNNGVDSDREG